MSVDDVKDEINGFLLAPQEDGTFIFFPDEATTRTYTFFEGPRTYIPRSCKEGVLLGDRLLR